MIRRTAYLNLLLVFVLTAGTAASQSSAVLIRDIQGNASISPLAGRTVSTSGIVTAVKASTTSGGFFIQERDGSVDSDPSTSEGLLIFTGSRVFGVNPGDLVTVTGNVVEFRPSSDPASPTLTEISAPAVVNIVSSGNPVPSPSVISASDLLASGGFEQLERFEGMRVKVGAMISVAPTEGFKNEKSASSTSSGLFYAVIAGTARPFREPGIEAPTTLPSPPCCIPRFDGNPERIRVDSDAIRGTTPLDVTTGQRIENVVGVVDYSSRTYTILPDMTLQAASPPMSALAVSRAAADEFTVASFNMERFYDAAAGSGDVVLTAEAFANRLNKASLVIRNVLGTPDIIGLQEVENIEVLRALAEKVGRDALAAGGSDPRYAGFVEKGNDAGSIEVGFLVKTSRVSVSSVVQEGKDTVFVNPANGQNERLNDRPPLLLRATVRLASAEYPVTVITNHLRSLIGVEDEKDGPRVRAKRRAQAEFLARLIQARQSANPDERIVSLGDLNAFQFNDGYVDVVGMIRGQPASASETLLGGEDIVNPDLRNLIETTPGFQRYSFVFNGNAQALDHILVTSNIVARLEFARSNADFPEVFRSDPNRPERLSDHDMPVAFVALAPPVVTPPGAGRKRPRR